jgi:class 3 adenylate cyclase/TolB-like protein/Tfp pilus assembly protein PilF
MVAVLIADVVGYSRLMCADEEATHVRLNQIVETVIAPQTSKFGGRTIRTQGDSLLIEFESAVDAVRCAVAIQREIAQLQGDIDTDEKIELRIGINSGDVIADAHDIYGNSVNLAARLEQLAEPGTVYVSAAVYDQVRSDPGLRFLNRGRHRVKNIDRPVRVYRVEPTLSDGFDTVLFGLIRRPVVSTGMFRRPTSLAAVGLVLAGTAGMSMAPHWRASPGPDRLASVLVVPFRNSSEDGGQQYFADAVTDDIATDLSRLRDVTVLAPGTSFAIKGETDSKKLHRDLGVRYLVTGAIRRTNDQVKTNVQLIDAASGLQVWGERFETDFSELGRLEDTITGRIGSSLSVEVVRAEGQRAQRAVIPDGLDLRLRATSIFYQSVTPENTMTARRLLMESVRLDPRSAEAWARLSQITGSDYLNRWNNTGPEQLQEADNAAQRALRLDPNLSLAHFAIGFVRRARGQHQAALDAFTHAIELNPNFALAYAQKAEELTVTGHPEEAIPLLEQAIRLSPRDPSLGIFFWYVGRSYFFTGHYAQAIPWLRRSVEVRPNLWYNRLYLTAAFALNEEYGEARRTLDSFNARFPVPRYTLQTVLANEKTNPNDNPVAVAARENLHQGLLRAGLPES